LISLNKAYVSAHMIRYGIKSKHRLAVLAGVTYPVMYRLWHGRGEPGARSVSALLAYFNAPFEKVFIVSDDRGKRHE
jgi:hypothetical protein